MERNFLTSELDPSLFSSAVGSAEGAPAPPQSPSESGTGSGAQPPPDRPAPPYGANPAQQSGAPNAAWYPADSPSQTAPGGNDFVRRNVHGDPLMRRMGHGVRKAVGASAAQNVRQLAEMAEWIRRPIASCRQIAVTSIRGGAGKTTVSALTAAMIADYRGDRVLAVDADAGLGSLPLRLKSPTERSLHDLARVRLNSFEETGQYLGRASESLWVLPATTAGRVSVDLELETFRAAIGNVTRYFSAAVIDCGAGLGELQRGILTGVHGQIIVAQGTADGALSTRSTLEWMFGNGYGPLLSRTVIVLMTHSPHVDSDLERARHMLSAGGMPVVHVPYDRQLATGAAIDMTRISEGSRVAATRIAAEILARSAIG
ncbi:MinD/ParA family protein [Actinomadura sp. HBU206391]|uniref:MinD/ParA family ATP-binding protein n=1 Tax=Actinomadura sp. HBU206391 TaxID=2731692 RepID=UPI001650584D|nr:MinD/ParA family protein [Actinomadura sp. HBU206391]MBC6457973.1 MinD/ParA family protein [Actinomadura sp. HBU206391]